MPSLRFDTFSVSVNAAVFTVAALFVWLAGTRLANYADVISGRTRLTKANTGVAALVILAAGWVLARTGDSLARQTGLGSTFVGLALVAGSTSLPELSTSLSAVRRGNHQMAVSNILGTNCLELALFFLADAVYRGGPILAALDRSALVAATVGMVVTCIFLLGLLERRDRTVLGMGVDSLLVLIVYSAGLVGLYAMR